MSENLSDWTVKQYPEGYAVVIQRGRDWVRVSGLFATMSEAIMWGTEHEARWEERETCRRDEEEERHWGDEE